MMKWNGGGVGRPQSQQGVKMSYLVLKGCVAGGESRSVGDVIELTEQEGKSLTAMGRVQEVTVTKEAPADRSVALETSDAPKLTTRKKV
jgi:hypothetical protein